MLPRQKAAAVLGIALAAFLAVKGVTHLLDERTSLVERAQKVGTVPADTRPYLRDFLEFFPLSQTEVLLIQQPGGPHDLQVTDGQAVRDVLVYRLNLQTGKAGRALRLERAISAWPWFSFRVSPDGQWLVCAPIEGKRPGRLIHLKMGSVRTIPLPKDAAAAWFPDSTRLLALSYEGKPEVLKKGLVFHVKNPGTPTRYPLTPPFQPEITSASWNAPPALTPDGRLLIPLVFQDTRQHPWHMTVILHEFQFAQGRLTPLTRQQFDPPDLVTYDQGVRVNRQGTRLLWQAQEQTTFTRSTWMLFTSRPDGSDLRRVGRVPMLPLSARVSKEEAEMANPEDVNRFDFGAEWLPDGKTICFAANGGLYLIKDE